VQVQARRWTAVQTKARSDETRVSYVFSVPAICMVLPPLSGRTLLLTLVPSTTSWLRSTWVSWSPTSTDHSHQTWHTLCPSLLTPSGAEEGGGADKEWGAWRGERVCVCVCVFDTMLFKFCPQVCVCGGGDRGTEVTRSVAH